MKMLPILVVLVAGALCGDDMRAEFQKAYAKYKVFDGLMSEPPQVAALRYKAFVEYANVVNAVNADDKIPYEGENNFLSILTPLEREGHMGLNVSGHEAGSSSDTPIMMQSSGLKVAASRDFSKKIAGIKNQGNCGSCWTFAATAALEGEMYFVNSKKGVSLSEQEYMECSTSRDGCQGGWMADCYTYTRSKDRIAPTSAVPYKGKDSRRCNYGSKANAMTINGVKLVGNKEFRGDDQLLQYANAHIVSVAIKVTNNFMIYSKGIFTDKTCQTSPNHAVAVVGYGVEGGRKFWNVRNSWGTGWGSSGYIKMSRDVKNICMISTYSHIPQVVCRGNNCKKANPDDDSDGGDDGGDDDGGDDGGDDGDKKLCLTKIGLGACMKTEAQAKKTCDANGVSEEDCIIAKVRKCYYAPSGKEKPGKNFVEVMVPCGDDDKGECDAAAGLVLCSDCNCCKHEHMCYDKKL